jgi:molybdopterin synthase catalytic subunit
MPTDRFELTAAPVDAAALRAALAREDAGAVVCFEGVVRDHNAGRRVLRLAYQAFDDLAAREGNRILAEARARHAIARMHAVHRVGVLEIGAVAVWVGVSAAHRDAAFAACRYAIDELKRRVPIWKKEFYAEGESEWLEGAG